VLVALHDRGLRLALSKAISVGGTNLNIGFSGAAIGGRLGWGQSKRASEGAERKGNPHVKWACAIRIAAG
jgi:hypothetical protein